MVKSRHFILYVILKTAGASEIKCLFFGCITNTSKVTTFHSFKTILFSFKGNSTLRELQVVRSTLKVCVKSRLLIGLPWSVNVAYRVLHDYKTGPVNHIIDSFVFSSSCMLVVCVTCLKLITALYFQRNIYPIILFAQDSKRNDIYIVYIYRFSCYPAQTE